MWTIDREHAWESRFKQYAKNHPNEVFSCFKNLDRLLAALNSGLTLMQCTFGFFRNEGMDV